jgi:c-di-GMP-binding flagellar brake protein YcgR
VRRCNDRCVSDEPSEPEVPQEQRREHVRVELLRRCVVALPNAAGRTAELVDLSGTGCGFLVRSTPLVGDQGRVSIDFDDWALEAGFEVRVVRAPKAGQPGRTYVGVRFEGLDSGDIDRIVREVFATMRRQIRNVRGTN